jgi:hypothetical protein
MGQHTKMAAALMTAGISGGAIFPVIQWATESQRTLKFSFVVPLVAFTSGWIYPVYLQVVPAARHQVQSTRTIRYQRQAARMQRMLDRPESEVVNLDSASDDFGLAGIITRRCQAKSMQANKGIAQHIERQAQTDPQSSFSPSSTFSSEMLDLLAVPNAITLRRPSGIVGELKPWLPG